MPLQHTYISCNEYISQLSFACIETWSFQRGAQHEADKAEWLVLWKKRNSLTFAELLKVVGNSQALKKLPKSRELAKQHGLYDMTMDQVTEEVKAVRKNAKDSH